MKVKIFIIFFSFLYLTCFKYGYAQASMLDDAISSGKEFFQKGQESFANSGENDLANLIQKSLIYSNNNGLFYMIREIAQFTIFVVALLLGLKYIFSGIEGKTIVKETLPSFVIAVILIYMPRDLTVAFRLFFSSSILTFSTFDEIKSFIWTNVLYVVQILCLVGIIFLGLKYMWSSGEKKGEYKNQAAMMIIGLILVLSCEPVIRFIANVAYSFLKVGL